MISLQRWVVAITALGFGLYHAALGIIILLSGQNHEPKLVIIALAIYLVALVPSVTMYRQLKFPLLQALANLGAAIAIPLLMQAQLGLDQGGFATWYIAAIETLLTITAVRQHIVIAWVGLAALWVEVIAWHGPGFIISSGLIGALIIVASGTGLAFGLASAEAAAIQFTEDAKQIAVKSAAKSASRAEQQARIQETLRGSLPMLRKIVALHGQLDPLEKEEARLLEAELRDEMVGRRLIDALVRDAAREGRRRGLSLTFLDEGGLDTASVATQEKIRFTVAQTINETKTGRVVVRAPKGQKWRTTVVVSQPGSESPDVFLRLT